MEYIAWSGQILFDTNLDSNNVISIELYEYDTATIIVKSPLSTGIT